MTTAEPMLGVTNTNPFDEASLLSLDPGWWAPASMRIGEVTSIPFHLSASVIARTPDMEALGSSRSIKA